MRSFIITPKNHEKSGINLDSKAVIIPSSFKHENTQYIVKSIGARCFKEKDVESVILPSSITKIGLQAFCDCHELRSINFSENITEIGESAFYNCFNLGNVKLSSKLSVISKNTFSGCEKLIQIYIPENVDNIYYGAFSFCKNLEYVYFPNVMEKISANAIYQCNKIERVNLPQKINILYKAVSYCHKLRKITIPDEINKLTKDFIDGLYTCDNLTEIVWNGTTYNLDGFIDAIRKYFKYEDKFSWARGSRK